MAPSIVEFAGLTTDQLGDAARLLRVALAHLPSAYGGPGEAEAEVEARCSASNWLGFAAIEQGVLVGWIGAIRAYAYGWELHPLVVDPPHQRRGIGSALLVRLEARACTEGVLTLFLGSDDDHGGTSLFGRDLFPDVISHATTVAPTARGHAMTFYRRHGFEVVGLLPDVNGPGCHDILMAKRIVASV